MLEILHQVLREPTLPEEDFEVHEDRAASLPATRQGRSEPQALAANRLQRLMSKYPKDDVRYVPTIDESIERMKAASIDQVRTLYRQYLGASQGELAIVGDFEPSEVLPIVDEGSSRGGSRASPTPGSSGPSRRGTSAVKSGSPSRRLTRRTRPSWRAWLCR